MHWRGWLISTIAIVGATHTTASFAQVDIGRATSVQSGVEGSIRGNTKLIESQDSVFQNERLRTDDSGQAQLVFIDYTKFDLGPKSEATVNRFIYNPDRGTGRVKIEARRGVYHFVTGQQDPTHYEVNTPIATLEPRGTEFHLLVERDHIVVALVYGALRIVPVRGRVILLDQPWTTITIFASGKVDGPMRWTGAAFTRYAGYVPFPNFISNFAASPCCVGISGGYIASKALPVVDPWVGFYVGANLGGSWGDWRATSNQRVYNFETFTANPKVNGVVGGVQAGYNWRLAPQWLWGIEGDIQGTSERGSQTWIDPGLANTLPPPPPPPPDNFVPRAGGPATLSHEWKFPWFGTVRLRAGYNPTTNWLLYVTGGLAYGESQYSFNFMQPGAANNFPPSPTTYALHQSQIDVGYAVGAGAEVKLDRNWSLKGEYLFLDLGTRTINARDIDGLPFSVSYSVRDHIARIGLNYAFGQ